MPLTIGETEDLADWFARHLPSDLRGRLMAERPLLYEALFPGASHDAILERVRRSLAAQARDRLLATGKPVAEALLTAVTGTDHPWQGSDTVDAVTVFIEQFGVPVPDLNEAGAQPAMSAVRETIKGAGKPGG
jgi:hypothetical protein